MSPTITWLHLSDLHLCGPKTGWDADKVLRALQPDLRKMAKEHGLHPDLIFFTGDAAYGQLSADQGMNLRDQYRDVHTLFEEVRRAFTPEIPQENFFLVPGNHDVNRDSVTPADTDWLDRQTDPTVIVNEIQKPSLQWRSFMRRLNEYRSFLEENNYNHLLSDQDRLVYSIKRQVSGVELVYSGLIPPGHVVATKKKITFG
jgi:predicted MPP superfamily phosphohydrolase